MGGLTSAEAGRLLSVPAEKVDGAVKNLQAERDELVQTLNQLKWKYFTLKAEQVAEGTENILFFGEGLNSKDMTHFADLLLKKRRKADGCIFSRRGRLRLRSSEQRAGRTGVHRRHEGALRLQGRRQARCRTGQGDRQ